MDVWLLISEKVMLSWKSANACKLRTTGMSVIQMRKREMTCVRTPAKQLLWALGRCHIQPVVICSMKERMSGEVCSR
jgi:hypothetical protein